jgi:hypothetical protein
MSGSGRLVAARFNEGTVAKGWTSDFRPTRESFLLLLADHPETVRIRIAALKALFFLKTLEGDPAHEESKTFDSVSGEWSRCWVEFRCDGEALAGWSSSNISSKLGFFLVPADTDSNFSPSRTPLVWHRLPPGHSTAFR